MAIKGACAARDRKKMVSDNATTCQWCDEKFASPVRKSAHVVGCEARAVWEALTADEAKAACYEMFASRFGPESFAEETAAFSAVPGYGPKTKECVWCHCPRARVHSCEVQVLYSKVRVAESSVMASRIRGLATLAAKSFPPQAPRPPSSKSKAAVPPEEWEHMQAFTFKMDIGDVVRDLDGAALDHATRVMRRFEYVFAKVIVNPSRVNFKGYGASKGVLVNGVPEPIPWSKFNDTAIAICEAAFPDHVASNGQFARARGPITALGRNPATQSAAVIAEIESAVPSGPPSTDDDHVVFGVYRASLDAVLAEHGASPSATGIEAVLAGVRPALSRVIARVGHNFWEAVDGRWVPMFAQPEERRRAAAGKVYDVVARLERGLRPGSDHLLLSRAALKDVDVMLPP